MQYRTPEHIAAVADISSVAPPGTRLTHDQRLVRWAESLDRLGTERLNTLMAIEYRGRRARDRLRCDGSALSVALGDPVLRGDGLQADSFGAASRYFGLSSEQLHRIVCYCHFGRQAAARDVATAVRAEIGVGPRGLVRRLAEFFRLP